MFRTISRAFALLLLGWFAFMTAAAIAAATRRREAVPQDPAADEVDLVACFGPLEFHSEAAAFRGGTVTTWFGGGVLDLRDATLDPAGATLRASAMFGGGLLVVPEAWKVETRIGGIGGVGDSRPAMERPAHAPTLRFEGIALFGGWGISSDTPEATDAPVGATKASATRG